MNIHPLNEILKVGNGSPESCTEAALDEAVAKKVDINFNCGSGTVTIPITHQKILENFYTIDGGNKIILDADGATNNTRIFKIATSAQITIKNITLQRGNPKPNDPNDSALGQGRAMFSDIWSTLYVDHVTFKDNSSLPDDHACMGGGAIFIGGFDHVYIMNSKFINNKSMNGGAINDLTSDLYITNSVFDGNTAMHDAYINRAGQDNCGGAIYIDGASPANQGGTGQIIIDKSIFTNNVTNNYGGAIVSFLYSNDHMSIDHSVFESNQADFYSFGDDPVGGCAGAI